MPEHDSKLFQPQSPETAPVLNHLANHECKALGYVALSESGEVSPRELAKFVEYQTNTHIAMRTSLINYLNSSVRTGFASMRVTIGASGHEGRHYTAENQEKALPLIGSLLEWSEEHDESLVRVLGRGNFRAHTRPPLDTVQIFDGLLQGLTLHQMESADDRPLSIRGRGTPYAQRLNRLLEKNLIMSENPEAFQITNIEPRTSPQSRRDPFERAKPLAQTTYQVLAAAKRIDPDAQWTLDSMQDLAIDLGLLRNKPSKVKEFRLEMTEVISGRSHQAFDLTINRDYQIVEDFKVAAHDMVDRIKVVDSAAEGGKTKKRFSRTALELLEDPASAKRIFNRGVVNSLHFGKFD